MAPDESNLDLDGLERDIRSLRIEFTRFFAGDRERPPFEEQDELSVRIRRMMASPKASTVEQFRLNTLSARLRSLKELYERRLRQHRARASSTSKPTDSVLAGPERGNKAVRRLFRELYKDDEAAATMPHFQEFIERKTAEIRSRTGCSSVQFRVIENDGKRTLKAKPLGRAPSESDRE